MRGLYLPFESASLQAPQTCRVRGPRRTCTNLLFQSKQLGLSEKWAQIKAYAQASPLLSRTRARTRALTWPQLQPGPTLNLTYSPTLTHAPITSFNLTLTLAPTVNQLPATSPR